MRRLHRRTTAALIGSATLLAACGGASSGESSATQPQPQVEAPVTEPALAPNPDDDATSVETDTAPADTEVPVEVDEPIDSAPESGDTVAPETDDAPPPTETAAPEAPVEPMLGGRTFASEVTTESQVLPDLLVDDIRRGQKINLRNVFPAERPVLVWAFAPH